MEADGIIKAKKMLANEMGYVFYDDMDMDDTLAADKILDIMIKFAEIYAFDWAQGLFSHRKNADSKTTERGLRNKDGFNI